MVTCCFHGVGAQTPQSTAQSYLAARSSGSIAALLAVCRFPRGLFWDQQARRCNSQCLVLHHRHCDTRPDHPANVWCSSEERNHQRAMNPSANGQASLFRHSVSLLVLITGTHTYHARATYPPAESLVCRCGSVFFRASAELGRRSCRCFQTNVMHVVFPEPSLLLWLSYVMLCGARPCTCHHIAGLLIC